MAEPMTPEPKFFLVDELWQRGLDYYSAKWFDPLPAGRLLGEKSANYLESPVVAQRIRCALPQVKLVFVLRNPVDRARSSYLWSRQNGLETETFERALALEEQRERELPPQLRYARPHAYFSRAVYADLLATFLSRFPRGQILVLRYEVLATSPEHIAADFYRSCKCQKFQDWRAVWDGSTLPKRQRRSFSRACCGASWQSVTGPPTPVLRGCLIVISRAGTVIDSVGCAAPAAMRSA